MTDIEALKAENLKRWNAAKLTRNFDAVAKRLVAPAAKAEYQAVQDRTSVPWAVIAVIHEREASQDWSRSIAQGDPFDRPSVHVPAGRGPFKSWREAAYDALVSCSPYAAHNKDWSIGGALTLLEEYNGLGYAGRGLPSPYIWSGTDQYTKGKYVRDGVFDPEAVDQQTGCAGLLKAMMALDLSISLTARVLTMPTPVQPKPAPQPQPAQSSRLDALIALIKAIFGRK
jgi:lysozyme family protein